MIYVIHVYLQRVVHHWYTNHLSFLLFLLFLQYRTASLRSHNHTIQVTRNIGCNIFSFNSTKKSQGKNIRATKCRTRYLVIRNGTAMSLHTNSKLAMTKLLLLAKIIFCLCIFSSKGATRLQPSSMFLQPTNYWDIISWSFTATKINKSSTLQIASC